MNGANINSFTTMSGEDQSQAPPQAVPEQAGVITDDHTARLVHLDDMDEYAQDQPFSPPAHIAARLNTTNRTRLNTRRKSSAASSRRNSLSSAHSSHLSHASSHQRARSVMQSHSIAQHLRRASIIESRRARLADRSAHVEQVRLRAALLHEALRGNNASSTREREERALAAQLAKEKYLAKVAATCAEEVARAKRIAEEVRGRREEEEVRVRREMEERHAEAEKRRAEEVERRRAELQARRARRADSGVAEKKLAAVEEENVAEDEDEDEEAVVDSPVEVEIEDQPGMDLESAATKIQSRWRCLRRMRPVQQFRNLNINTASIKSISFEDMTGLVAETRVIERVTAMLIHLGLQEQNDKHAALNTRTFLSAFMILSHPTEILQHKNGAQEQDLIAKAHELIALFEAAVSRLAMWNQYLPNPLQLESLSQCYTTYTSAFAAWRLQDSSVLIEGMVASFVELDRIWQTVKDDTRGEVSNDYREGIRDNQVVLLSQIRKLAGPDRAGDLIKKAIRESRRSRPRRRPVAEVRPRIVDPATQPPAVSPVQTEDEDEARATAAIDRVQESTLVSPDEDASPLTLSRLFSVMPSNRILTHELAINKDFKLQDRHSDARAQLYAHITRVMQAGFRSGNAMPWTLAIAENVREKLLKMTKPAPSAASSAGGGGGMHRLIMEALDPEMIARQCERGIFSYAGFFEFMADLLPKLCAPFRDQAVAELSRRLRESEDNDNIEGMVAKLFDLLLMIDKLNLDYTNFMIMNAAPLLIQEAAGYEQRQFARDLETGARTLVHTQQWWQRARATLHAQANHRDPSDRPTARRVHARALLDLALRDRSLSLATLPETLHLDFARLQDLRVTAIRIVTCGAILLTTKNLLKRDVRSPWRHEAGRLWSLLLSTPDLAAPEVPAVEGSAGGGSPSPAQRAFSILETAHNLPPATKVTVAGQMARFFQHAAAALAAPSSSPAPPSRSPSISHAGDDAEALEPAAAGPSVSFTDPVLKLLMHRLVELVRQRTEASSDAESVRAASSASERLASSGMPEFTEQVKGLVDTLEAVRRVDWEGHGRWYLDM